MLLSAILPPLLLKLRAVLAWTHFCEPHLQSKDLPRQFAGVRALTDSVSSPTQSAQRLLTTLRVNIDNIDLCAYAARNSKRHKCHASVYKLKRLQVDCLIFPYQNHAITALRCLGCCCRCRWQSSPTPGGSAAKYSSFFLQLAV